MKLFFFLPLMSLAFQFSAQNTDSLISSLYFNEMNTLNNSFGFPELSMGMSADYIEASKNSATYVRIGSSIFGNRV